MKSFTRKTIRWCSISCSISSLLTKFNIVIIVHELIVKLLSTEDEEEKERKELEEMKEALPIQRTGKTTQRREVLHV